MAYNYNGNDNKKIQDECKRIYDESEALLKRYSKMMTKAVMISSIVLLVSYIAILIFSAVNKNENGGAGVGNFVWLFAQFLVIPIFLYDPQTENSKDGGYETDMKFLLDSQLKKVKTMKIRIFTFIAITSLFSLINVFCWVFVVSNLYFNF